MTVALSVTTADADPDAPPYRISAISGHTLATIDFTVTGAGEVGAFRLMLGGTARTNGEMLSNLGAVAGFDRCGTCRPLSVATPAEFTESIDYATVAGADGDYDLGLYVRRGETWE